MMGGYGMMAGMGWLGMITMLVFWVGVILLIVWGVSAVFPTHLRTTEPDALEILRRRYTQRAPGGEISHEEFEHARQALR